MKNIITYILVTLLLISCDEEKRLLEYSQKKADQFVEKYTDEFLEDKELLKYSYNPRSQFAYAQDPENEYMIFPREDKIRIHCFSKTCELTEPFNHQPLILLNGTHILKGDSIISHINNDSTIVTIHSFKTYPEDYYRELKNRLVKYGAFAYYRNPDKSFLKVYLSGHYYLIHTKEVENYIFEDEIIKTYDNNWYFVKMESPMDLG